MRPRGCAALRVLIAALAPDARARAARRPGLSARRAAAGPGHAPIPSQRPSRRRPSSTRRGRPLPRGQVGGGAGAVPGRPRRRSDLPRPAAQRRLLVRAAGAVRRGRRRGARADPAGLRPLDARDAGSGRSGRAQGPARDGRPAAGDVRSRREVGRGARGQRRLSRPPADPAANPRRRGRGVHPEPPSGGLRLLAGERPLPASSRPRTATSSPWPARPIAVASSS